MLHDNDPDPPCLRRICKRCQCHCTVITSFRRLDVPLLRHTVLRRLSPGEQIALVHLVSEWLVYGTMQLGKGILPTLVIDTSSIIWMAVQKDYYVR